MPGRRPQPPVHDITPREEQLVMLATAGLTETEMAKRMGLSLSTIKSYWTHLRQKVGAANRTEAVTKCLETIGSSKPGEQNESETLWWRVMCRQAPWIVIVLDRYGKIFFVSRSPIRGGPERLVGRHFIDLAGDGHAPALAQKLQDLRRGTPHLSCSTSLHVSESVVLNLWGRLTRIDHNGTLTGFMFFVEKFERASREGKSSVNGVRLAEGEPTASRPK